MRLQMSNLTNPPGKKTSSFHASYLPFLSTHVLTPDRPNPISSLTCQPIRCYRLILNEWMNEWSIYIALYCVLLYTQSALQSYEGVSLQPPPVCSIHLDDATAATGQRRQCAHHTPATGGEEREIEPIKWMGIIGRPWLTKASGGKLARTPGLHPYSLRWVSWDF